MMNMFSDYAIKSYVDPAMDDEEDENLSRERSERLIHYVGSGKCEAENEWME